MAAQEQTQVRVVETAAGALVANNQSSPIKPGDASLDRDDWPGCNDSLMERFLNNLRMALSGPHT